MSGFREWNTQHIAHLESLNVYHQRQLAWNAALERLEKEVRDNIVALDIAPDGDYEHGEQKVGELVVQAIRTLRAEAT